MTVIDGALVVFSTAFGTKGFATIQPGSGTSEEQISFTGITQNANGTALLTGVKSVTFISPYTETTGLLKTHAGSTTLIISNTSGFYNELTSKDDDETVNGIWTFTQSPIVPDPTTAFQAANKEYVDNTVIAGAPDASTTVKGIARISVAPVSPTNPIAVGQNDPLVSPTSLATLTAGRVAALAGNNVDIAVGAGNLYTTQTGLQHNVEKYAADAQANDTYVITLSPAPTSYTTGMVVYFKANTVNTGTATLNVNGLGAKTIVKGVSTTLADGDIAAGQFVTVIYDGTNFVLQNPTQNTTTNNVPATTTTGIGTTQSSGTVTITHGLGRIPIRIEVTAIGGATAGSSASSISQGVYNNAAQNCVYTAGLGSAAASSNSFSVFSEDHTSGAATQGSSGVIGNITLTTFDIVWTNIGGTGGANGTLIWNTQ